MNTEFLKNKVSELVAICKKAIADGENIVVTGHDMPDHDSIISAVMLKELLALLGVESKVNFCTRPDGVTLRGVRELGIYDEDFFCGFEERDRLILVDHHVSFYPNKVIGCVDHHTTPPEPTCPMSLIAAASSCGRVIYDMAVAADVCNEFLERLALQSVYLDTQSCRSPKFEKSDIPWLEEGIARHGIDRARLEKLGFCLCDPCEDEQILVNYGYKQYEFEGKRGASSCVQIDVDRENDWQPIINDLIGRIVCRIREENLIVWAFVVNKPEISRSDIYFIFPSGEVQTVKLDRIASRSRDVIPVVEKIAKTLI
jgi:inorganic pyrophosphatase/exopolyphosphatase